MSEASLRAPTSTTRRIAHRYELAERLGAGGAATVYRAYDTREQRWLALKLLAADASAKLLAMFRT